MLSPKNYVCSSISNLIIALWLKNGSLHVGIKKSVKNFVISSVGYRTGKSLSIIVSERPSRLIIDSSIENHVQLT